MTFPHFHPWNSEREEQHLSTMSVPAEAKFNPPRLRLIAKCLESEKTSSKALLSLSLSLLHRHTRTLSLSLSRTQTNTHSLLIGANKTLLRTPSSIKKSLMIGQFRERGLSAWLSSKSGRSRRSRTAVLISYAGVARSRSASVVMCKVFFFQHT